MNGRPDRITRGPPDWVPSRVELPGSVSTYLLCLARSTSCVWCPRVGVPVTAVTAVGPDLASGRSAAARSIRLCRTPRVRSWAGVARLLGRDHPRRAVGFLWVTLPEKPESAGRPLTQSGLSTQDIHAWATSTRSAPAMC